MSLTWDSRRLWSLFRSSALLFSLMLACGLVGADSSSLPLPVSLISLVSNPQKYHGKPVSVVGYFNAGQEASHLFLGPYDSQEYITSNAVFLDFARTDKSRLKEWRFLFDHQTVVVVGTFYYPGLEGGGVWTGYPNGIIGNISEMRRHDVSPLLPSRGPTHD